MPAPSPKLARHRRRLAAQERERYIDAKTDGGAMVWDFFLALLNDADAPLSERREAAKWLNEHGSAGKVADRTEVEVIDDTSSAVDFSHLSLEQAREMEQLMARAQELLNPGSAPKELPEAEVVDAVIVEGEP